jgi:hypothetical protein
VRIPDESAMIAKSLLPAVFSARWLPGFLVLGSCLLSAAPERPLSIGVRQTVPATAPVQADLAVELKKPDFVWRSYEGVVGLTESAGRHPLDDGIRKLTVFGIQDQPKVERKDGTVTIEAPGVRLNWKGAEVETEGATIKVKVGI